MQGGEAHEPSWTDGQLLLRLRPPGGNSSRIIRVRKPFALIGRISGADVLIDDASVGSRHVYLHVDRRGVFGIDLVTRTGTRFAGVEAPYRWLCPGDSIEVSGHRIEILQIRIHQHNISPRPCVDNPLAETRSPELDQVVLEPIDGHSPPWILGSELVFMGRGESCGIKISDASRTHCALARTWSGVHLIDLIGKQTSLNDQVFTGSVRLKDGDIIGIGESQFLVRIELASVRKFAPGQPGRREPGHDLAIYPHESHELAIRPDVNSPLLARLVDAYQSTWDTSIPNDLALGDAAPLVTLIAGIVQASQGEMIRRQQQFQVDLADALKQIQSDTSELLESHLQRIEAMNAELNTLKQEIRTPPSPESSLPPIPAPPRLNLPTRSPEQSVKSATWMLDRIHQIERENKSSWRDLLSKLTTLGSRPPRIDPESSPQTEFHLDDGPDEPSAETA